MAEKRAITGTDVLRWARAGFTTYMILYGVAALASKDARLPTSAVTDVAVALNLPPHRLLAALFLVPGLLLLGPRTRVFGLWLALISTCTFEVGLIVSAVEGQGTFTAPVAIAFISMWAAILVSLRKVRSGEWLTQ